MKNEEKYNTLNVIKDCRNLELDCYKSAIKAKDTLLITLSYVNYLCSHFDLISNGVEGDWKPNVKLTKNK